MLSTSPGRGSRSPRSKYQIWRITSWPGSTSRELLLVSASGRGMGRTSARPFISRYRQIVDTLSTLPHLHTTLACACELSTAFYSAKTSNQLFIVLFPSVMCHFVIFFIRAFNKRWKFNFSVFLTQCKYIGRIEKLCSECSRVNEVKADLKTISH